MVSDFKFFIDQLPVDNQFRVSDRSKLSTLTRTHLTVRHGIRAKCNQLFVAQSEVGLAQPDIALTSNPTIAS